VNAALLIRLCYPTELDDATRWRFYYFQHEVLPRILHQEDAEFDLWLWVNPLHRKLFQAMDERVKTFTVATVMHPLETIIPWSAVRDLPRYPIQLRLDSDDLIGPRYVATALRKLRQMEERRALVFFQPWKYDVATRRVFIFYRTYAKKRPSAFLALRQPVTKKDYSWVYGRGHTKMHRLAEAAKGIPLGHCWMSCHSYNDSTGLDRRDTPTEERAAQPSPWW
jgi:hypothetical protein